MANFATAADLASFLQVDVDAASADLALSFATAAIRRATAQHVELVTGDTVTLTAKASAVFLPEIPVLAVTAVRTWDAAAGGYGPSLDPVYYSWTAAGQLTRLFGPTDPGTSLLLARWPSRERAVQVTYDHGYAVIPDELRMVCVTAAARLYTNPEGVVSRTIGSYSERLETTRSTGVDFSPFEKVILSSFRPPTVS